MKAPKTLAMIVGLMTAGYGSQAAAQDFKSISQKTTQEEQIFDKDSRSIYASEKLELDDGSSVTLRKFSKIWDNENHLILKTKEGTEYTVKHKRGSIIPASLDVKPGMDMPLDVELLTTFTPEGGRGCESYKFMYVDEQTYLDLLQAEKDRNNGKASSIVNEFNSVELCTDNLDRVIMPRTSGWFNIARKLIQNYFSESVFEKVLEDKEGGIMYIKNSLDPIKETTKRVCSGQVFGAGLLKDKVMKTVDEYISSLAVSENRDPDFEKKSYELLKTIGSYLNAESITASEEGLMPIHNVSEQKLIQDGCKYVEGYLSELSKATGLSEHVVLTKYYNIADTQDVVNKMIFMGYEHK